MGAGIAQVAAQAGHPVRLFDMREGAAAEALRQARRHARRRWSPRAGSTPRPRGPRWRASSRSTSLAQARDGGLVVEAIVENLEAKRALFRELEGIVAADCVLATNTSSICVTAIANGLQQPGRAGRHALLQPGAADEAGRGGQRACRPTRAVAEAIFELSKAWGKVPVHARARRASSSTASRGPTTPRRWRCCRSRPPRRRCSTPACKAAGFRMGPCELMDLIGHDTNFAVTNSVYEANFHDKRYVPSLVQREMVDGGLLGRKSGRGFYRYDAGSSGPAPLPVAVHEAPATARRSRCTASGRSPTTSNTPPSPRSAPQGWGPARDLRQRLDRPVDRRRPAGAHRRPHRAATGARPRRRRHRRVRPPARAADRARHRARLRRRAGRARGLAHAGRRLAGRAGLHAAAAGRCAGPGGGAHDRHADQRRRRRRAAGRVRRRRRRCGDEARRQLPGRALRVAGALERATAWSACCARSMPSTAASATASAPGCAAIRTAALHEVRRVPRSARSSRPAPTR